MPKVTNKVEYWPLDKLNPHPSNPRIIKDAAFKKLVDSINANPDYFEARPLILSNRTGENLILAGNMRYKAAKEIGLMHVPCILLPGLDEQREREIMTRDNVNNGDWDWERLQQDWDAAELNEWGLDVPSWSPDALSVASDGDGNESDENLDTEEYKLTQRDVPDELFGSDNDFDIPALLFDLQAVSLDMPIAQWGSISRQKQHEGTWGFYIDDYRFAALWKDPSPIVNSNCINIIEPNFSLNNNMPLAIGIERVYKKRWLARFWQKFGIRVFVDMNVSDKFMDYNLLGVPKGWGAYCTRLYADNVEAAKFEYERAVQHAQRKDIIFIVYGGGQAGKKFAQSIAQPWVEDQQAAGTKKKAV